MKLKHGKKYETVDGVVYRVRKHPEFDIWDVCDDSEEHWDEYGKGEYSHPDLIRRHYTKPKPDHKLDLKPGDVVELVAWEDIATIGTGKQFSVLDNGDVDGGYIRLKDYPKGERPLFRVVSRS